MKPGIYTDISNHDYHAGLGLGSTQLREFSKSPAHYMRTPTYPSEAMILGSYTDSLLTEPQYVDDLYVVLEEGQSKTAVRKTKAIISRKLLISYPQHVIAEGIVKSVNKSKVLSRLLTGAKTQHSIYWHHPKFGFLCKCRPDFWQPGDTYDLKTSKDASEEAFAKDMAIYKYHWQAEWYTQGIQGATNGERSRFHWIVGEKEEPYNVGLYSAPKELLYFAGEEIKLQCQKYAECLEADNWPGYPDRFKTINLPLWYYRKVGI